MLQLNKEKYATEEDKVSGIYYWAKLFKTTTAKQNTTIAEQQAIISEHQKQLSDKDMEIARLKAALAEKK